MRVERNLHIQRGPRKRNVVTRKKPVARTVGEGHTQRISKLMALAIRFDGLLRDGTVKDQSELATLAHVSQPRMTQIMNLLLLAPQIQEELLHLPKVTGKDVITEKLLRPIVAQVEWATQVAMWRNLSLESSEDRPARSSSI
ncbi:MAG: hypothetical protein R3C59_31720 [Planctomycetaceae bacterium]